MNANKRNFFVLIRGESTELAELLTGEADPISEEARPLWFLGAFA